MLPVCAAPAQVMKQAPAWLKRPCSVAFGFGGILASFCNSNTVAMSQARHTRCLQTTGPAPRHAGMRSVCVAAVQTSLAPTASPPPRLQQPCRA